MPSWTEEQKQVITLRGRNILVSAAAGSGKTAVLVERIIQMITEEEHPADIDRLLVVTFTRAAAGEMQKRVGEALEQRLFDDPENEHLQRQLSLLHNAQITTIDSFCQNIVRNYFHTIQLDPAFRIADEPELTLLKAEILRELLEEQYAEGREEFLAFAERFAAGRTDSALESLILSLYTIAQSYPWPLEWLEQAEKLYDCADLEAMENTAWMKELEEYLHQMTGNYLRMAKQARNLCLESDGPDMYLPAIESDVEQLALLNRAGNYREYADVFHTMNAMRLSSKRGSVSQEKKDRVKSLRNMYWKNGVAVLQSSFFFQEPEEMLADIRGIAPSVRELVRVTREFMVRYSEMKREKGLMDFSDLEHFALDILVVKDEEGNPHPSETAKELQDYYEEILTDEYQDSNYVQELILSQLSRAPEQKPYLFMVGDVKQSIYQFRLARPEIFMDKYRRYTPGDGPNQRIDLHKNFRSRETVLRSANFIFERIMQEALGGIVYDEAASLVPGAAFEETEQRTAGRTKVLLIERKAENAEEEIDKAELEAAVIGRQILDMVTGEAPFYVAGTEGYRRAEYRDIVILLRSPGNWTESFIEVLTDMGIPAYCETKTGYFSTLEVETVLNLLRIIDNPRQDIPLTAVLRSCMAGLTDEELAAIAVLPRTLNYLESVQLFLNIAGENIQETEEKQKRYCSMLPLTEEQKKTLYDKLSRFWDTLLQYRELAQYVSVYELLQKIYQSGYYDIMSAMPAGEKRAANLDMLLQQAVEFGERGQQGIFTFVRYIESLRKSDIDFGEAAMENENANAVRIMSIHKSKGLEFPVVFVAGLGKMFNMQDIRQSTIIDADYGIGADYLDGKLRIREATLIKRFLASRIRKNTLSEEIRILYVALTRAKEQLILTGSVRGLEKKFEKWKLASSPPGLSDLTGAQTYLDWIMPVLLNEAGAQELFSIETEAPGDVISEEADNLEKELEEYTRLRNFDSRKCYDDEMAMVIKQQMEYRYPYEEEQKLPVKVSVSELKRREMLRAEKLQEDRNEGESLVPSAEKELIRPSFLEEKDPGMGAMRGTLYHLAMEHLPYEEIAQRAETGEYDWQEYLESLCRQGYLTKEQSRLLDGSRLADFVLSSLGRRMQAAAVEGRLKREQQFMLGIPAKELYPDSQSEELVLVQGIIDAYFREGEELVLVDYKTDRVKSARELADRYRIQLHYYAQALERLTGRQVREQIIYSLELGEEILL